MKEMVWFANRFKAVLSEDDRDLTTATRADIEQFNASFPTPARRSWAWRSEELLPLAQ